MIYAQIKNNLIINTIQIDDITIISSFMNGYDACVQIDNITPQPAIGWSYDGTNFTNQITLPDVTIPDNIPSGSATTFPTFMLSINSNNYIVSINGSVLSIGCQNYDYATFRYILYMLLVEQVGSIGPFTESSGVFLQNNQFVVTVEDVNLIYAALCTLL